MSPTVIGLIISAVLLVLLTILFCYEKKNGIRFCNHVRILADFFVLKTEHVYHTTMHYISRDFVKQTIHYIFHTLLKTVLSFITRLEKWIRNVMRVNKTLARYAERESATLSKLEEIAIHKAEVALTEEEKQAHKDKALRGF